MMHWSGKLMKMTVREMLKKLQDDGWFVVRTRGDHRQLHHPTKPGTVTLSGKMSRDIPPKTLRSVLRQAQLLEEEET